MPVPRLSSGMMADNATQRMMGNLGRLYDIQEQVASGKKYQTPSENPSSASRALQLRSTKQANEAFIETADRADLWISSNEEALKQLTTLGTRANTLAKSATTDTLGPGERASMRAEMKGIIQSIINAGNSEFDGKYIFNGYLTKSGADPFQYDETNYSEVGPATGAATSPPYTPPITPSDSAQNIVQKYGPGQQITVNISGEDTVAPLLNAALEVYRVLNRENVGQTFVRADLLAGIDSLNKAMEKVKEAVTTNGTRQREIRAGKGILTQMDAAIKSMLSKNEDVNMAEAISEMNQSELAYRTSLEVTNKALSTPTLFDYIS